MSSGVPCKCKPPDRKNWAVVHHMCNYSAFNGYHRTSSDYSEVKCTACGGRWRTKAKYVSGLRDG